MGEIKVENEQAILDFAERLERRLAVMYDVYCVFLCLQAALQKVRQRNIVFRNQNLRLGSGRYGCPHFGRFRVHYSPISTTRLLSNRDIRNSKAQERRVLLLISSQETNNPRGTIACEMLQRGACR